MKPLPFERLMVIAPHPDDETLGAGGLLHRAAREGVETAVLGLVVMHDRVGEMEKACRRLGVGRLDVVESVRLPELDDRLLDEVDQYVQGFAPDALSMPFAGASHQEHRMASAITMSLARPLAAMTRQRPSTVMAYEQPSDAWTQYPPARPRWYVELSQDDVDAKLEAMACHASQCGESLGVRGARSLQAMAELRGAQVGVRYAEAFEPLLHVV